MMRLLIETRFLRSFIIFFGWSGRTSDVSFVLANQVFIIDTVSSQCEQEELVCVSIFVSVVTLRIVYEIILSDHRTSLAARER